MPRAPPAPAPGQRGRLLLCVRADNRGDLLHRLVLPLTSLQQRLLNTGDG